MKLLLFTILSLLPLSALASPAIKISYFYPDVAAPNQSILRERVLSSPSDFPKHRTLGDTKERFTPIHFAIQKLFSDVNSKSRRYNIKPLTKLSKLETKEDILILIFGDDSLLNVRTKDAIRLSIKLTISENLGLRSYKGNFFEIPEIKGFILQSADGTMYPKQKAGGSSYYPVCRTIDYTKKSEQVAAPDGE